MKKENIQSRNRKLSAKARKKHSSFPSSASDMLKPLYGYGSYYMPPPHAAAAAAAASMNPYHPHTHHHSHSGAAASHIMDGSGGINAAGSPFNTSAAAAAGMSHMMAASSVALGGFAPPPPSLNGMVSGIQNFSILISRDNFPRIDLSALVKPFFERSMRASIVACNRSTSLATGPDLTSNE